MKHKPPSIADIGLRLWLNDSMDTHNGHGFNDLEAMLNYGVSDAEIARRFNVTRLTAVDWKNHYKAGHIEPQV